MEFKYQLNKKDYQKIIYEKNTKTNLIYIILMSLLFLIITFDFILSDTLVIFILYVIYIISILLMLFVLNNLLTKLMIKSNEKNMGIKYGTYTIKVDKNKIVEEIEDFKYKINFNDIRKIKYTKNSIVVYQKSKLVSLTFKKDLFKDSKKFDKLRQILKEK